MQRLTISIEDRLAETFDSLIRERSYSTRSEAVRDIVREAVERWRAESGDGEYCVANLSYVYDRRIGSLAERLAELEHEHHDLVATSTALRLDHDHSLVSVMFKGRTDEVQAMARLIGALRGVRFAKLNLFAVQPSDEHLGSHSHRHDGHEHLSPVLPARDADAGSLPK